MTTDAYLETRVLTADPIELTHMLYQRAIDLVGEARQGLRSGDVTARCTAILKAVAILGELEGALDHEAGGEISQRLAALYRHMQQCLTMGNVFRRDEPLAEAEGLLQTLAEAWNGIRPAAISSAAPTWAGSFTPASELSPAEHGWSA